MWKALSTNNVFTLEASFCGPNMGDNRNNHFRVQDYHSIGYKLCQSVLIYAKIECPSLRMYLEVKEKEEFDNEDEQYAQDTKGLDITSETLKQKFQNQLPVYKQSNINFTKDPKNTIQSENSPYRKSEEIYKDDIKPAY
jgi:hypothetical protein